MTWRWICCARLLAGAALAAAWPAHPQTPPPSQAPRIGEAALTFDIPPQPLASAIEAFAAATGVQIIYDRPIDAHSPSPGVAGVMTPEAALRRLLAGQALVARFIDSRDVVLEPVGGAPPPGLPRLVLDPLKVEGLVIAEPALPASLDPRFYGRVIQSCLQRALADNPRIARDDYRAELRLWIGSDGQVLKASLIGSSGEPKRDSAIVATVQGLILAAPPPADLPQPVRIAVRSRSHP